MSHAEGAAVEQADAVEYDYSCGNAAVEEGGESYTMLGTPSGATPFGFKTYDFR